MFSFFLPSPTRRVAALPLFALALAFPESAQDPAPRETTTQGNGEEIRVFELTLEDAMRIALRNNLALQIEELSTESAHYEALGSWGAFDPVYSLTASYDTSESQSTGSLSGGAVVRNDSLGYTTGLSIPFTTGGFFDLTLSHASDETNNSFAAFDVSTTDIITVALTQPLLKGAWKRFATTNQRLAEMNFEIQRQRERQMRQRVLLDVSNTYWDLVSTIEELGVRDIAVDLGQRQLDQDEKRLEVGVGTEVDVLQSETNVAQQDQLLLQAIFNLRTAEDNLRRILSRSAEDDTEELLDQWDWPIHPLTKLPQEVSVHVPDWRTSLHLAEEHRPELAQRRLDIDAAEIGVTQARSDWLPVLDLSANMTGVGFDSDPAEAFDTAASFDFPRQSVALTFRMPVFRRTARNRLRSSRAGLRSARLSYDSTELDVLAEVRAAVRDISYLGESVNAAVKSRSLAQRQLEAEKSRQRVGSSTTFQVLQFQEDLASALSVEVAARAAFAKALVKLEYAEGQLDIKTAREADPGDSKE